MDPTSPLQSSSILQEEDGSLIEQTPVRPRSTRDAKEIFTPARGSPTVYTFGGKERRPNNRSTPQKSTTFQRSNNKRTASRTGNIVMFTKTLHRIKTVTKDDVFVGYRRSEHTAGQPMVETFTTDLEFVPKDYPGQDGADGVTLEQTQSESDCQPAETANSEPEANAVDFALLAQLSPSRSKPTQSLGKQTAKTLRAAKEEKKLALFCIICSTGYKTSDDLLDPWIGCSNTGSTGVLCQYWAHASCIGFLNLTKAEVNALPNWLCPQHNVKLLGLKKEKPTKLEKQKNSKRKKVSR